MRDPNQAPPIRDPNWETNQGPQMGNPIDPENLIGEPIRDHKKETTIRTTKIDCKQGWITA